MKLLEVKHVHKCYANTRRVSEVLHDLSFAAEEGSFTAIMGKHFVKLYRFFASY